MFSTVKRFALAVSACMPAILILGMGILGIYTLYTVPIVTVQQTPSQTIWDMFPPAARRIWMLMISLFAFAMMLLMITMEWNWQTRPITDFINTNARVGFAKAFGIWLLIIVLASGLDIMLQPYAKVNAFELSVIVASCIVVYDVVIFWEMLRDVVKHMLFSLLFLVTIVNLFVTIPVAVPFRDLMFVGAKTKTLLPEVSERRLAATRIAMTVFPNPVGRTTSVFPANAD